MPPADLTPDPDGLADREIASWVAQAGSARGDTSQLTALSAFQRTADAYPQLTADAQLELHKRVVAGRAAAAELAKRPSGRAAVKQRRLVADGERAAEYLAASNFKLALLICRELAERRYGRERALSVLADLVAEATVALAEAVATFDPTRTPRFSTFSARLIRDRVRAVISDGDGPVSVPPSWKRLKRIAKVRIPKLAERLGRQPTIEEIQADLTGYCMSWADRQLGPELADSPEPVRREAAAAKLRKQGMERAIKDIEEVLQMTQATSSLDAPTTDDGSRSLGDMLVGDTGPDDTVDPLDREQLRALLAEAMEPLSDRDRQIVLYRYGFMDGEIWTYTKISSELFDITPERVRQIDRAVLARLRTADGPIRDRLAAMLPSLDGTDLDVRAEELGPGRKR